MDKKKILFVCPFPIGTQAGQRFKFEQHMDSIKNHGFIVNFNSFFDVRMVHIIYSKGFFFKKIYYTIKSYFKRYLLLFYINKYDVVYLFLWGTPFFDTLFERILQYRKKKLIYDIEDNVFIIKKNEINPFVHYLKSTNKIKFLIKSADYIITSSVDLKKICAKISNKNNCKFIPPTIFNIIKKENLIFKNKEIITLGWTGTFSSITYLSIVENVISDLSLKYKVKLLIISNSKYENKNFETINIQWNKKNELKDLLKIDIGLYPVIDEHWAVGKSGLKALQYMALGIPTIASNVGSNKLIIKNDFDGFLVNNNYESWYRAMEILINDLEKRKTFGLNAQKKISEFYSKDVIENKYMQLILN